MFPVGDWALAPLENAAAKSFPPRVDGIVVLGGDEDAAVTEARGQPAALDSMRRYAAFASLARQFPQARLVYTGGSGSLTAHGGSDEADVARLAFGQMGLAGERVVFEEHSRTTHENAVMAAVVAKPEPGQNWLLVTSAFHMQRAMACFRHEGWRVFPAPAGYFTDGHFHVRLQFRFSQHLERLELAFHEYYGLIAYWLMGYTDTPWPE